MPAHFAGFRASKVLTRTLDLIGNFAAPQRRSEHRAQPRPMGAVRRSEPGAPREAGRECEGRPGQSPSPAPRAASGTHRNPMRSRAASPSDKYPQMPNLPLSKPPRSRRVNKDGDAKIQKSPGHDASIEPALSAG